MNLIIWFVVGGLIGWLASVIIRTDSRRGVLINTGVGVLGAFVGGWMIAPMFRDRIDPVSDFGMISLLISFACAITTIAVLNIVQGCRLR